MTATAAFAQITLDLDVLTDDLTATAKEKSNQNEAIRLTPPEREGVAPAVKKKTRAVKKASPAKPVVKKPTKPKAPNVKKPAPTVKKEAPKKPAQKFEVKEAEKQDAHDKLKPRANPVPVVTVIPTDQQDTDIAVQKAVPIEPKLSKHFLEKQQKEKQEPEIIDVVKEIIVEQIESSEPAPRMLLNAQREQETTQKPSESIALKNVSVIPVAGNLTPREKSNVLAREIPADSATAKAVSKYKNLNSIFIFENNSAELTTDMLLELEELAKSLEKDKTARILLFSYSGSTAPEYGKERQISLRRALMVRSALTRLGISSLRVELRSHGANGAGERIPNRVDILVDDN